MGNTIIATRSVSEGLTQTASLFLHGIQASSKTGTLTQTQQDVASVEVRYLHIGGVCRLSGWAGQGWALATAGGLERTAAREFYLGIA